MLNAALVKEVNVIENHNDAVIANLTAADDDASDTHSFHLLDSANGKFRIEGRQLVVKIMMQTSQFFLDVPFLSSKLWTGNLIAYIMIDNSLYSSSTHYSGS